MVENSSARAYDEIEEDFQSFLDESLQPRGPESLYELVSALNLPVGASAVDIGCGRGREATELARRFGLRVHGIDPSPDKIDQANRAAQVSGSALPLSFSVGSAERLPLGDESVDLVWSKEALTFLDLLQAFNEMRRVLKPGGYGLAFQVLPGPAMTDAEAEQFCSVDMGFGIGHNVRPADVEAAIAHAGLTLRRRVDFGGEWGEFAQESSGTPGRRLVHVARLLRDPDRYRARFGDRSYKIMLGDCLWHVYRMIGKLQGVAFVFARP
jgi:ubiquinone/menaquinone biosynthesis C-methylase UbiE